MLHLLASQVIVRSTFGHVTPYLVFLVIAPRAAAATGILVPLTHGLSALFQAAVGGGGQREGGEEERSTLLLTLTTSV